MDQEEKALFDGLRALSESTFPKNCTVCGKVYETVAEFVKDTEGLRRNSGLKSSLDDDDRSIVELFRNCACGSTLMSSFSDRRDISPAGLKRRVLFGQLLTMLTNKGVDAVRARSELLKFIQGHPSELLEKMGVGRKT